MQIIESAALAEESWLIKTSAREGMEERIQVKTKCVGTEQRDESNDVVFTRADGVDAAAGGADVAVLLHEVDEHLDGVGREVDVAVQRQQNKFFGELDWGGAGNDSIREVESSRDPERGTRRKTREPTG